MRLGNSDLNTHKTGHGRNRLCRNCDGGIPETLDHFFLGCKKYINARRQLKNNIKKNMEHMKIKFTTRNLLGMNERIMKSRKLMKKYEPMLKTILLNTINYIKYTERFKLKMY